MTPKHAFLLTIAAAAATYLFASVLAEAEQSSPTPASPQPQPQQATKARLDLAFCIDTTGSMQAEIDTVKAKVKSVVAKLTSGQPKPVVRVGLVAYRDQGDEYVTKVFPFTVNIDQVVRDISDLKADGGGDMEEAVDYGLHMALNDLKWDSDKRTAKVLFVIGDAPPHPEAVSVLTDESRSASASGIRINTIACAGLEDGTNGVSSFKQMAALTNGSFQSLAYHQEVVDASGKRETLITSAGKTYKVKPAAKGDWKEGAASLAAKGMVETVSSMAFSAPMLQGATNGTIGPQGSDATVIAGAGSSGHVEVRSDNNLDAVMLQGAQEVVDKVLK